MWWQVQEPAALRFERGCGILVAMRREVVTDDDSSRL